MKTFLNIAALVLIAFGAIWFLQGAGLLPGSFMTGRAQWAVIGGLMLAAGAGLLLLNSKKGKP